MNSQFVLPRLYAIVDTTCFKAEDDLTTALLRHSLELAEAGVTLLQYRSKHGSGREKLGQARELRRELGSRVTLIMNDRADLCLAADFDGVHVGQDDLPPAEVRPIIGTNRVLGFSTHNPEQVTEADKMPVDYIAIGPVFETASKVNPDPVIGVEGVRRARALTKRPLVAIGGITHANCCEVIDAGADSVAVISGLLGNPRQSAAEFLRILG